MPFVSGWSLVVVGEELFQRLGRIWIGRFSTEVDVLRHRGTGVAELVCYLPAAVTSAVECGRVNGG
jgi:hypothetical protein